MECSSGICRYSASFSPRSVAASALARSSSARRERARSSSLWRLRSAPHAPPTTAQCGLPRAPTSSSSRACPCAPRPLPPPTRRHRGFIVHRLVAAVIVVASDAPQLARAPESTRDRTGSAAARMARDELGLAARLLAVTEPRSGLGAWVLRRGPPRHLVVHGDPSRELGVDVGRQAVGVVAVGGRIGRRRRRGRALVEFRAEQRAEFVDADVLVGARAAVGVLVFVVVLLHLDGDGGERVVPTSRPRQVRERLLVLSLESVEPRFPLAFGAFLWRSPRLPPFPRLGAVGDAAAAGSATRRCLAAPSTTAAAATTPTAARGASTTASRARRPRRARRHSVACCAVDNPELARPGEEAELDEQRSW